MGCSTTSASHDSRLRVIFSNFFYSRMANYEVRGGLGVSLFVCSKVNRAVFHSTKNSSLHFRKISLTHGTAFPGIKALQKLGRCIPKCFRKFTTGNLLPFDFPSRNFWLNGSPFENSYFSNFPETSLGHFSTVYICLSFEIFEIFG